MLVVRLLGEQRNELSRRLARASRALRYNSQQHGQSRSSSPSVSSALHFYQNRQLELYAAKETKRLTLRQLVSWAYIGFVSLVESENVKDILRTEYE